MSVTVSRRSRSRSGPLRMAPAFAVVAALLLASCNWRGPNPTEASVTAALGPFSYAVHEVPSQNEFDGGAIYYPTGTTETFGTVAVVSGFINSYLSMDWYGPRLASQGFVVFFVETLSGFDPPIARAQQLREGLHYLIDDAAVPAAVRDRVDPDRLAVMGWSMGGGGALDASLLTEPALPPLKAVVALAPWQDDLGGYDTITVPSLVVSCGSDIIAPDAEEIYDSLTASVMEKEFIEIARGEHRCVTNVEDDPAVRAAIARQVISWLKRWVDGDTRYTQFICPPPSGGVLWPSDSTCPMGG